MHVGVSVLDSAQSILSSTAFGFCADAPRVEIDEPMPEDLFFEDREIGADGFEVEGHLGPR